MGIFYDMMMNGILESNGGMESNSPGKTNGLDLIAHKVQEQSNYSQQSVFDALKYAVRNGFMAKQQGQDDWQWVEELS